MKNKIKEGLMVHAKGPGGMKGAPGVHVGTVDHLDGERYVKLKKSDSRDHRHHWIPMSWVESVNEKAILLNKTEMEFHVESFDSFPGETHQEAV